MDTKFQDSVNGAKAALKAMADKRFYAKMEKLTFRPDPQVQGVWGVFSQKDKYEDGIMVAPKCECVIYLAGYPGPFGNIRIRNDFEG